MAEVHIYPQLCEQLGTSYKISKNDLFEKIIDLNNKNNNNEYNVAERLKTLAKVDFGLEVILQGSDLVTLVQQPDTYGWFWVRKGNNV